MPVLLPNLAHADPRTPPSTPAASEPSASTAMVLDSSTLLQGQRAITIQHNGTVYRLQATRQGKLILTK